jgi:hypothetical protein
MKHLKSGITAGILILLLCLLYRLADEFVKPEQTHIEKIIKQHNSIKDLNQKYPTINTAPSSQSTVFAGDSVRIIRK